jgi:HEPN domain-containing protein
MFDIEKYSSFLQNCATEDLQVAEKFIVERQSLGFGLYFVHSALQKTLAAIICRQIHNKPPWRTDLTELARLANIQLSQEQRELCKTMNFYHKEGLYLGLEYPKPTKKQASDLLTRTKMLMSSLPISLA